MRTTTPTARRGLIAATLGAVLILPACGVESLEDLEALERGRTITIPDIEIPTITIPDLPEIDLPTITIPDIELPTIPGITIPDIDIPGITIPDIEIPGVPGIPNLDDGAEGGPRIDRSGELPEEWPSDVPPPIGLADQTAVVFEVAGTLTITLAGTAEAGALERYLADLVADDFDTLSSTVTGGRVDATLTRDRWTIVLQSNPIAGRNDATITLVGL